MIRHLDVRLTRGAMFSCKKIDSTLTELKDCHRHRHEAEDEGKDSQDDLEGRR